MSNLNDVLTNPIFKTGLGLLAKTQPEIGFALELASTLLQGWHDQAQINATIIAIDVRAAEHIKRLATEKLHSFERSEIEIRLHELLTILIKL